MGLQVGFYAVQVNLFGRLSEFGGMGEMNRTSFAEAHSSGRIAHYGTDTKREDFFEAPQGRGSMMPWSSLWSITVEHAYEMGTSELH